MDMVPVTHVLSLLVLSKLVWGFFCASSLKETSFWDDSHVTNVMQSAAYGQSTDVKSHTTTLANIAFKGEELKAAGNFT